EVVPGGGPHQPSLINGPRARAGVPEDAQAFQRGRELAAPGSLEPGSRDRLEPQPRAACPGEPLLAFQPLPDWTDQVVVGELIIRLCRTGRRGWRGPGLARRDPFEIRRGDQAEIVIEHSYELGKIDGAVRVTRHFTQKSTGAGAAANHRGR